ncbi:MAG: DNA polymerase domain-containing protein [Syntrophomonadaceae bacterium]|nr:DNA polymerase domain-containing protein [Syntrophomonadaceae bacterium]
MIRRETVQVQINDNSVQFTNLDKVFWPEEGYTKLDVLNYYTQVAPFLLPHLRDRPMVMVRYPNGITGHHFYQKECPDYAPDWVRTISLEHSGGKRIHYCLCNNLETLLWLVNQGAIELHPWLSRYQSDNYPDFLVFDLDPDPPSAFPDTIPLALVLKEALAEFDLQGFVKTSGATGLHLYVPIMPQYPYSVITQAAGFLASLVAEAYPRQATVERMVRNRGGRVYLDYLQNGRGKTLASVYCLRPIPGGPVSMPVTWEELTQTKVNLDPTYFTLKTAPSQLQQRGDLFAPVLSIKQRIDRLIKAAGVK